MSEMIDTSRMKWQLCCHMVNMITLCARGRHDRGIRDRRAVIAAHRTRHTCGDGKNTQE